MDKTTDEIKTTKEITEFKIGGGLVSRDSLSTSIKDYSKEEVLGLLQLISESGLADQGRLLLTGFEIMATESAFADDDSKSILEKTAESYNLGFWCDQQGKKVLSLTRLDLISQWDYFMTMAGVLGFKSRGVINPTDSSASLWKATANLAEKMMKDPAKYAFLPPLLINDWGQVEKKLMEIDDPIAFIEVLVGEAIEDIQNSSFMKTFIYTKADSDTPLFETAISNVMLILQRNLDKE